MSERASTLVRRPARGGLLYGSLLAHRDRELLILRTALNCHADSDWAHHVVIGKQAGRRGNRRVRNGFADARPHPAAIERSQRWVEA
jgi:hypothetical protein